MINNGVAKYNKVTVSNSVMPNYVIANTDIYFKLYISPHREICIIGEVDNNYIVWCSITKLDDRETNEDIFNYLTNNTLKVYTNLYKAIGSDTYSNIVNWHQCSITKTKVDDMAWTTPFGHYYGSDSVDLGRSFARDILSYFDKLQRKCVYRISNGQYLRILENYYDILSSDTDPLYHQRVKDLLEILNEESYLRLSSSKTIRELYIKCMNMGNTLYNRYMTAVR